MSGKEEAIAAYLSRVTRKYGVERVMQLAALPGRGPALEGASPGGDLKVQKSAEAGIKRAARLGTIDAEQVSALEALILPKFRPAILIQDGDFSTDHPLWLKLNTDEDLRKRLKASIPSVGRIELPGASDYPYGGTGFVVGRNLVMTNRHVAAIFATGLGLKSLAFVPGRRAGINFFQEHDRPTEPTLAAKRIVMIHPYWDMALLEVEGLTADHPVLPLAGAGGFGPNTEVAAIGYPAFDRRNNQAVQNDLFSETFQVKRLQPGKMTGRADTDSFGKKVSAALHDCSTLGGNSGSALVDFATGNVLALHFGGVEGDTNFAVPMWELARDKRVVDAGVVFAQKPEPGDPSWASWWSREEYASRDVEPSSNQAPRTATRPAPAPAAPTGNGAAMSDGSIRLTVPLEIIVRLGGMSTRLASSETPAAAEEASSLETMAEPFHEESYSNRSGYDPDFLDQTVPAPEPADPGVVAPTKDGDTVLHYENFSIVMHARRRLALFTASNVTAEPELKRPDPRKKYSRKDLSGLGPNDQERWFIDPRIEEKYQLTDVFYNKDRMAFDKGHIVRREDVAWGETYTALRRANGDTYHITNCSPQVAGFNRSANGELNWGDLENHVLKGASQERYCQFAGPVLKARDTIFIGSAGGNERIKVRIPSSFWKVIVSDSTTGLRAYGFVLEQDLDDVEFEEFAPADFKPFMTPIADIQKLAGIVFDDVVRKADQFDTAEGLEMAWRASIQRKSAS